MVAVAGFFALAIVVAIGAYGFYLSTSGRPLFRDSAVYSQKA